MRPRAAAAAVAAAAAGHRGLWSLSSGSFDRPLPFPLQNVSQGLFGHVQRGLPPSGPVQWHLHNANHSVAVPARFPSVAHLDLLAAGLIPDPNVRLNEGSSRWVADQDWTYTADLDPLLRHARASCPDADYLLHFTALDTAANISLGSALLAQTANSFRPLTVNITAHARQPGNLSLAFQSPRHYADRQSEREAFYPTQNTAPGREAIDVFEYANRQFVRKQQSDFGWDWGPAYLPTGPVGQAYLVALSHDPQPAHHRLSLPPKSGSPAKSPHLWAELVTSDVHRKGQLPNLPPDQSAPWVVNITLDLWSTLEGGAVLEWRLENLTAGAAQFTQRIRKGYNPGLWTTFELPASGPTSPRLWWPRRMGEPHLYNFLGSLRVGAERLDWSRQMGFRTIVLNQEDVSDQEVDDGWAPGSKWQVEVNGQPLYIQGANYIPSDTFAPRRGQATLFAAQAAEDMGLNLIRIWGGGRYESDELYEHCDRRGILLWSELIFACGAAYPTLPDFLSEVDQETRFQARRLGSHASTAFWAGNNEGEQMMLKARQLNNGSTYEAMYEHLFQNVTLRAMRESTHLSYIPASTGRGYTSLDPYVARYFNGTPGAIYGDAEHYNYDPRQAFNVSSYPASRFVNEYGYHSFPSIYTIDSYAGQEDWGFNTTVVRAHNKHSPVGGLDYPGPAEDGQAELTWGAGLYFPHPPPVNESDPAAAHRAHLAQWAYASQVFQGAFMGSQTLMYRVGAALPQRTSGVTFWQLNQVWQGSDWSVIEYGGRWKFSAYTQQTAQARVAPFAAKEGTELHLWVVGDYDSVGSLGETEGELEWKWYDYHGNKVGGSAAPFTITGTNATRVKTIDVSHFPPEMQGTYLHLVASGTNRRFKNEYFWPYNQFIPPGLPQPTVTLTLQPDARYNVTCTGGVAPYFTLEHPEGVLGHFVNDDSDLALGFFCRPGEARTLRFVERGDRTGGSYRRKMAPRWLHAGADNPFTFNDASY